MRNTLAKRQLEIIKRHFRYKADEENHNRWCYRTKDYTSLLILYFRSYSNFCAKIAFFSCIAENISVFNKIVSILFPCYPFRQDQGAHHKERVQPVLHP